MLALMVDKLRRIPGGLVLQNTLWLALGVGFTAGMDFLVTLYLARTLGPASYGQFAFALAFSSLFAAFFDLGLSIVVTRECAKDQRNESYIPSLLSLKLILGVAGLTLVVVGVYAATKSSLLRLLTIIMACYVMVVEGNNFFYALFRARQKMQVEAIARMAHASLVLVGVVGVTFLGGSVVGIAVVYVCVGLGVLTGLLSVSTGTTRMPLPLAALTPAVAVWRRFLGMAVYMALIRIAGDAIAYVDSILLGSLNQIEQVGWYNAATKLCGVFLFPMGLTTSAIFPSLVNLQQKSDQEYRRRWALWFKGSLSMAVLIVAVVELWADQIIRAAFPPSFAPSAGVLRILVLRVACIYLHNTYYHALLVRGEERNSFTAVGKASVLGLVLNVILIPIWSLYGAAIVSVIVHGLILLQYVLLAARHSREEARRLASMEIQGGMHGG